MENIKNKAKTFWEDHKVEIIRVGKAVTTGILVGVVGCKLYNAGFKYGVAAGFNGAVDWLDETFPDQSQARKLYEDWKVLNPDKVTNVNSLGMTWTGNG